MSGTTNTGNNNNNSNNASTNNNNANNTKSNNINIINNISINANNTKSAVASLLEEHLSGILRDAIAIQRHAKRARLHQTTGERPNLRRRLHAADVNLALQLRGCERLYASNVVVPEKDDAYRRIDLEAYLRQEATLEPPTEVAAHRHWLAVDGVQPEIPENPDPHMPTSTIPHRSLRGTAEAATTITDDREDGAMLASGLEVHRLQEKILSEELQLYYTRVHLALKRGNATPETAHQQEIVLQSLARDTGLQELVPFLVRYIQTQLHRRTGNVEHCRTLVRAATALLWNPHVHLELYMHELIPRIVSCVVAKRLPGNHWALRRDAAMALVTTCEVFGQDYASLQADILKELFRALGPREDLASRFGGLVGIALFGPKAVDAYLLDSILACWSDWEKALGGTGPTGKVNAATTEAIRMCQQAALTAIHIFLNRVIPAEKALRVNWNDLAEPFGDSLVTIQGEQTDYCMCFV